MAGYDPNFDPALDCFPNFEFSNLVVRIDSNVTGLSPLSDIETVWANFYSVLWKNADTGVDCDEIANRIYLRNTNIGSTRALMTSGLLAGIDFMYPSSFTLEITIDAFALPVIPAGSGTGEFFVGYSWVQFTDRDDLATWKIKGESGYYGRYDNDGNVTLDRLANDNIDIDYNDGDLVLIGANGAPTGHTGARVVIKTELSILERVNEGWACCVNSACCVIPPEPNYPLESIVSPKDGIKWREDLRMSLPPAETKQPLANNTLPLNILRFLK